MSIKIPEGSTGRQYDITIKQEGNTTADDLSSFTSVIMTVASFDEKTVYNSSISLTFVDKPNGIIRYTTDSGTDSLPMVPKRKSSLQLKGQITLSGSGIEDSTFVFPIEIMPKIAT